VTKTVDNDT